MLLTIVLASIVALLIYEFYQLLRDRPTITEQARDLQRRFPGLVSVLMLAIGLVLGHLWWT